MKKILAIALVLAMVFAFAACGGKDNNNTTAPTEPANPTEPAAPTVDPAAKGEGVMTYAEYAAAEISDTTDTIVTIEAFVQGKQLLWTDPDTGESNTSLYTQDADGAYFIYRMSCTKEQYDQIVPGAKIKVTGTKTAWKDEVEIANVTAFEIEEGTWTAAATDVTDKLGAEALADFMNRYVSFKGLKIEKAADDNDAAFLYGWDGSGEDGSDLYFRASKDGQIYTFVVESDLCGADTAVYAAVKALKVGDVVDMEGFLYWYNGAQPHITNVNVAA